MIDLEPWLPHGAAMRAFALGDVSAAIVVYDDSGDRDEISMDHFFRTPDQFGELETRALQLCRGRVVDVGAGAGYHSRYLEDRGHEVCALEVLPETIAILKERGLSDVRQAGLLDLEDERFDTILMLMNGIGLTATVAGLESFLELAPRLLAEGGCLLVDSSDVRSAFGVDGGSLRPDGRYAGEITFQLEFDGLKGSPFPQLYADPELLADVASRTGWDCAIVHTEDRGRYLAQLTRVG